MTRGVLYHRRLLPVDRLAVSFKMKLVATCWTVLHLIEKVCFRLSPASSNQNPCHCELLSVCHHQSHVTLDSELSRFRCHAVGSASCVAFIALAVSEMDVTEEAIQEKLKPLTKVLDKAWMLPTHAAWL